MTLIGHTDKRGNAWHYREADQGTEPNHYPGAIPADDVRRRLFSWEAVEGTAETSILTNDGFMYIRDDSRKAICRPPLAFGPDDPGAIFAYFKQGYQAHGYGEWLINNVFGIIDASSDMGIGSAGLLRDGAQGWASIELPDSVKTASGVEFRPNLLAVTSLDGSLATTYQTVCTNVVCDNTMAMAMSEDSAKAKIRHSKYSHLRTNEIRDTLQIIHTMTDEFTSQVERLTNTAVSEGDWNMFLESLVPVANLEEGRALTMATNKRAELQTLYDHDDRVSPWKDTAYGVLQAVNTHAHHIAGSDKNRIARNTERAITGKVSELDRGTLATLNSILTNS